MSFLDKLQNFGIGNRGPYGRMKSGASYFSETIQDRLGSETGKGVNKAIIAASGGGTKLITPEEQFEIADRWGVPIQQVMKLSEAPNKQFQGEEIKRKGKLYWQLAEGAKKEGLKITSALNQKILQKAGIDDPEMASIIMGSYSKLQPEYKVLKKQDEEALVGLTSIAGNPPEAKEIMPATPKKPAATQKKGFTLGPGQKRFDASGKEVASVAPKPADGKTPKPEFYDENLKNGFKAIDDGAEPRAVLNKLIQTYPSQAKELKAIFDLETLPPNVKKELQESVELINAGKADKKKEYRRLAAKYSAYAKTLKTIMSPTSASDETLQAIAMLFNR
jgi:hypothetical protein